MFTSNIKMEQKNHGVLFSYFRNYSWDSHIQSRAIFSRTANKNALNITAVSQEPESLGDSLQPL